MWPRWAWWTTISVMPARTGLSTCQTIRGRPRTFSSGLGQLSVRGRMRSPRPAARIMAFIAGSEGVADAGIGVFQHVEDADQRRQFAVAAGGIAGVLHNER